MSDTYEAFYNGKPLNPNRGLPTMSYAQAEDCGLTDSERLWCRTDGDGTVITADEVPYDSNNSVKDKIDSNYGILNAKIQRKEFLQKQNLTFDNIPSTCTGLLFLRGFTSSASNFWFLIPVNVYGGSAVIDTPLKTGSFGADPTGASYSNGTLTVTMSNSTSSFFATLIYGN